MPHLPDAAESAAPPAARRSRRTGANQLWMALALILFVGLAATYMYSSRVPPPRPIAPAASTLGVRPPEATGIPSNEQPPIDRTAMLADLPPDTLATVKGIAVQQACSCDCDMTVWVCYQTDPTCEHAPAELRVIIDSVRGGAATPPTAN